MLNKHVKHSWHCICIVKSRVDHILVISNLLKEIASGLYGDRFHCYVASCWNIMVSFNLKSALLSLTWQLKCADYGLLWGRMNVTHLMYNCTKPVSLKHIFFEKQFTKIKCHIPKQCKLTKQFMWAFISNNVKYMDQKRARLHGTMSSKSIKTH